MIRKNMFDDLRSPEEKLSIKTRKFVNDINSSAELSKDYRKYGISTQGRIIPLEELKKRVAELKAEHVRLGIQPTQEFSHLIDIVENGIKVPKFRFFGDRKYKKVQKLFTPDYTVKLYTGEISSSFRSQEDFNDVENWRIFIDNKEKEYTRLKESGQYDGSFQDYLKEPATSTREMIIEEIRQKMMEEANANSRRKSYIDSLSLNDIESQLVARDKQIINRGIAELDARMNESRKWKQERKYRNRRR